jgi:hypothetical protein
MKSTLATAFIAVVALALPAGAGAREPQAEATPVVDAVWIEKDLTVHYMGFTSYYSCSGLREKVQWIVGQLGARPGFKVTTRGCVQLSGPEIMPSVRIVAALPVEATPEVLAQLAAGAAERELKARATGRSSGVDDAAARFQARPRRVEFRSDPQGRLQDGDCELMQNLRDQFLVPFGLRLVEDRLRCLPRQVSIGSIRLAVEVLEPVAPAAEPAPAP